MKYLEEVSMRSRGNTIKQSAAIALAFSCIVLSSIAEAANGPNGGRVDDKCLTANGSGFYPPSNTASLPKEVPRPGPDVLYWPLAKSPQLENTCFWMADPILISGASAYREGEFLYQDFLYDDTALTYPSDAKYGKNAADFVEIRLKPLANALMIRITYNTMLDPEAVATTIALGDSSAARPMPHNAGASMPAEVFVTVHGNSGDIVDAATGAVLKTLPTVVTDLQRRQVHVSVPYNAFDHPWKRSVLRMGAATGLWSGTQYLRPDPALPAFFNVAFRYNEPRAPAFPGNWRADSQNAALANGGNLSQFFANIDLDKLAAGVDDDMDDQPGGVPSSGLMSRILVSHFEVAQGRGEFVFTFGNPYVPLRPAYCAQNPCIPEYAGRLQPYEVYIPDQAAPPGGYGLSWVLHGLGGNYTSEVQMTPLAQQAPEFIFFSPEARGVGYWYYGQAGADPFEIWADIAARYQLNPNRTAIYGTSMGGYGTYKLTSQYPDLFARAHPVIGCHNTTFLPLSQTEASEIVPMAASFRNVLIMSLYGHADTACGDGETEHIVAEWDRFGYRYETHMYAGNHGQAFTSSTQPAVLVQSSNWLSQAVVDRNPPHVTFSMNAEMSQPEFGLNNDRAFWVSNLKVREEQASPPVGTIDVFSFGFGQTDPQVLPTVQGTGVTPGENPPEPFIFARKEWGSAAVAPVQDKLKITAANISELTIHVDRARVDCNAMLDVQSDGPLKVTLTGSGCNRQALF